MAKPDLTQRLAKALKECMKQRQCFNMTSWKEGNVGFRGHCYQAPTDQKCPACRRDAKLIQKEEKRRKK